MSDARPGGRVYLHIGAPKTGTTYLQDRLTRNVRSLARHGVYVPRGSRRWRPDQSHFKAALDLQGQDWGGPPGHAEGAWAKLVRAVPQDGTSIISHEILAPATPQEARRAMDDLAAHEVHVVYSARDLGRQLPAAWQESVKQGRGWGFRKCLDAVLAGRSMFGKAFDLPRVLETWGADLPPERIHVVTVPHERGDGLWQRYCQAFGIDPAWAPEDSVRANESLGIPETQLLRELNRRFDHSVRRSAPYDVLIRGMLGHDALAARGSDPVRVPPKRRGQVDERSEEIVAWLRASGVQVIGDPEDLMPRWPEQGTGWKDPGKADPAQVLEAAMVALESMTHEAARRQRPRPPLGDRARNGVARLRGQA